MPETSRRAALEWAHRAREVRFRLREQLRDSELTLAEAFELAQSDALVAQVKLLWTLESVPGAKKVLTRRKLSELARTESGSGLGEATRIGSLRPEQVALMVSTFGGAEPEPAETDFMTDVDRADIDTADIDRAGVDTAGRDGLDEGEGAKRD
ncbi:MAG TPA: hypothetical protein VL068_00945 [Microthrixaceae bacterium]|nr:hypothetical protein [Microthrixaceae bacterium]